MICVYVWYFPNGTSTTSGLYREYFFWGSLSKSKINIHFRDDLKGRLHGSPTYHVSKVSFLNRNPKNCRTYVRIMVELYITMFGLDLTKLCIFLEVAFEMVSVGLYINLSTVYMW